MRGRGQCAVITVEFERRDDSEHEEADEEEQAKCAKTSVEEVS